MPVIIMLLIHLGAPIHLACAGTSGQAVQPERCDGFLVAGDWVLPLWRAEEDS